MNEAGPHRLLDFLAGGGGAVLVPTAISVACIAAIELPSAWVLSQMANQRLRLRMPASTAVSATPPSVFTKSECWA